ncbi:MAG TPA: SDR family NAD(P)-dependent oxidoreductase [Longimicrobiales bacterium]
MAARTPMPSHEPAPGDARPRGDAHADAPTTAPATPTATALHGRTAVVTGGGSGIGEAIAAALAAAGAAVVVAARSADRIEGVARRLRDAGARAWAVRCDVSDPESVAALARAAAEHAGAIDILVNNAGIAAGAPLHRLELDEWNRILAVNATGTFLCTRAFAPAMVERGWGRIVNIASVAGLAGARYIAAYAASKHAVIGFTRSVAAELAGTGATINAVCPGYVDTPMTDRTVEAVGARTGLHGADALRAVLATTGQKRLISPDEVAHAALALCADAAGGINGQAIVVDGGALLA